MVVVGGESGTGLLDDVQVKSYLIMQLRGNCLSIYINDNSDSKLFFK